MNFRISMTASLLDKAWIGFCWSIIIIIIIIRRRNQIKSFDIHVFISGRSTLL